jgi:hypothetical protein
VAREVKEGQTEGGLPYLSFGKGPPLVVLPGLGMSNANPSGIQRWGDAAASSPDARLHGSQDKQEGRTGARNDDARLGQRLRYCAR